MFNNMYNKYIYRYLIFEMYILILERLISSKTSENKGFIPFDLLNFLEPDLKYIDIETLVLGTKNL